MDFKDLSVKEQNLVISSNYNLLRDNAIILQSKEEKYTVIPLEYDDIYNLQNSRDSKTRLVQLMEQVKKAQELGPQR